MLLLPVSRQHDISLCFQQQTTGNNFVAGNKLLVEGNMFPVNMLSDVNAALQANTKCYVPQVIRLAATSYISLQSTQQYSKSLVLHHFTFIPFHGTKLAVGRVRFL